MQLPLLILKICEEKGAIHFWQKLRDLKSREGKIRWCNGVSLISWNWSVLLLSHSHLLNPYFFLNINGCRWIIHLGFYFASSPFSSSLSHINTILQQISNQPLVSHPVDKPILLRVAQHPAQQSKTAYAAYCLPSSRKRNLNPSKILFFFNVSDTWMFPFLS